MFPRFEHHKASHRRPRRQPSNRQDGAPGAPGQLGAVVVGEPISVSEQIRFWVSVDRHLREIDAKHPGRVTPADVAKVKDAIARRISRPSGEAEVQLLMLAAVQRDVAAFDQVDNAEDAIEQAAKRLQALAREARPKAEAERLK